MQHKITCQKCGGFDYCDASGTYIKRHECQELNTNQLLQRIAIALEAIEKELK